MTVAAATPSTTYTGDGSTTAFSFPYKFDANSDLVVELVNIATDEVTLQTITTHYTVSGAGAAAGGTVTMLTAPSASYKVRIRRSLPKSQATDFRNQGRFYPETHESAIDYAVRLAQDLAAKSSHDKTDLDAEDDNLAADIVAEAAARAAAITAVRSDFTDGAGGFTDASTIQATGTDTARTIANWFGDEVNAKAFGCVGDDAADDTANLQQAIDYCESAGKSLYIPPGTYKVTAPLTKDGSMIIRGAGRQVTIINNTADGHCFNSVNDGANERVIAFMDMTIKSTLASGSRSAGACIRIKGPYRATAYLARLRLTDHFDGLELDDNTNVTVDHVLSRDHKNDGFRVLGSGPTTTVRMSACYASGNGRYGFYVSGVASFSGNMLISESNGDDNYHFASGDSIVLIAPYSEAAPAGGSAFKLDSTARAVIIAPRTDSTGIDALELAAAVQAPKEIIVIGGNLGGGTGYGVRGVNSPGDDIVLINVLLAGTSGDYLDPGGNINRILDADDSSTTLKGALTLAGGLTVGGGNAISKIISVNTPDASFSWSPVDVGASLADGDITSALVTVTGAAVGDPVIAGFALGASPAGLSAHVESADNVRVTIINQTGGAFNVPAGDLRVTVFKP